MPSSAGRPIGDPPQPEHADDVVDPHAACVPEHGADEVAEGLVAELGEPVGPPRRLAPVLAELVVVVRRGADLDALRVDVLQPPRVGAARVHPHGEVVHDTEAHPGALGLGLRLLELLVEHPLQPALEVHPVHVVAREGLHDGTVVAAVVGRPLADVVAVVLGKHVPGGEVGERVALPRPVRRVVELPPGAPRRGVHDPQGGPLRRPARVAVDRVLRSEPGRQLADQLVDRDPLVLGQRGVLGDPLDAEVERVEEPARAGQVRRGLDRGQRLGGVQRVDQDEVGAQLTGRPDGQVSQIGQVAEPPAAAGAHAVELGREPPLTPSVGPLGEPEPGGRDDQVGTRLGVAAAGPEAVVAER